MGKLRQNTKWVFEFSILFYRAILSNSKALNESIQNLQKFETFMNLLVDANDGLLRNERFLLKIVRLKFELDTCLRSLENYATIFQEVVDRSSIGYPSHFMFSQEFLTRYFVIIMRF